MTDLWLGELEVTDLWLGELEVTDLWLGVDVQTTVLLYLSSLNDNSFRASVLPRENCFATAIRINVCKFRL